VAVYRWSIVRSFFKAVHAFKMAGRQHRSSKRKNYWLMLLTKKKETLMLLTKERNENNIFYLVYNSLIHFEVLFNSGFYL